MYRGIENKVEKESKKEIEVREDRASDRTKELVKKRRRNWERNKAGKNERPLGQQKETNGIVYKKVMERKSEGKKEEIVIDERK